MSQEFRKKVLACQGQGPFTQPLSNLPFHEQLNAIRLATFIEAPAKKSRGSYKTTYCIEETDSDTPEKHALCDIGETSQPG